MLWNSFGTIAALLQEILIIYPAINPPTLTAHESNRCVFNWKLAGGEISELFKGVQCPGPSAMCGLASRDQVQLFSGTYPAISLPIFAYGVQNQTLRVLALDQFRSHWRLSQGRTKARCFTWKSTHFFPDWWAGGDHFSADDGNYPFVSQDNGNGIGTKQDSGHIHPTEDSFGRKRIVLYLPDLWSI